MKGDNEFLLNHQYMCDAALLEIPEDNPLTDLTMFLCTYFASFRNLHMDFVELNLKMVNQVENIKCSPEFDKIDESVVTINGNFGHAALIGYEFLMKDPNKMSAKKLKRKQKRKIQGDGTCFNSAVEPIVKIDNSISGKLYYMKCFPTTGEAQVPGVIRADFSDGKSALEAFAKYLTKMGVGDLDENNLPKTIVYANEGPSMINYKCQVKRTSPRMIINMRKLSAFLIYAEQNNLTSIDPLDGVGVIFKFESFGRSPRIKIFQSGKINILGASSESSGYSVYRYLSRLFAMKWSDFVCLKPRKDSERKIEIIHIPRSVPTRNIKGRILLDNIVRDYIKSLGNLTEDEINDVCRSVLELGMSDVTESEIVLKYDSSSLNTYPSIYNS